MDEYQIISNDRQYYITDTVNDKSIWNDWQWGMTHNGRILDHCK